MAKHLLQATTETSSAPQDARIRIMYIRQEQNDWKALIVDNNTIKNAYNTK